jgi:hypothetical protein
VVAKQLYVLDFLVVWVYTIRLMMYQTNNPVLSVGETLNRRKDIKMPRKIIGLGFNILTAVCILGAGIFLISNVPDFAGVSLMMAGMFKGAASLFNFSPK